MDTIQMTLRGVPVDVADVLRAQARQAGKSLNQYMIDRLSSETARFTRQQDLVQKHRLTDVTQDEIDEARRFRDAMKADWE